MIADGCFGGRRIARLDRVNDSAVFQQRRFASLAACAARRLKKEHRGLDVRKHLQKISIMRTIIDRLMESAIVVSQFSGIAEDLFFQFNHVPQSQNLHLRSISRCQHCRRLGCLPYCVNHSSTEQPCLAKNAPSPELDQKGTRTSRMNCVTPLIVQKVWRHGDGKVEFWQAFWDSARTHSKAEHQQPFLGLKDEIENKQK